MNKKTTTPTSKKQEKKRRREKAALFESMSRGWALGTKNFKNAVAADENRRLSILELGGKDYADIKLELWEREALPCMKLLGKKSTTFSPRQKTHLPYRNSNSQGC